MLLDFRRHLQDEFLRRTERNRRYSLRAFARQLGIGSSDLSKVLNDRRAVTAKLIDRLAVPLELSPAQVRGFHNGILARKTPSVSASQITFKALSDDTFRLVADWYHFGILELMKLPTFREDPAWIAKQFNVSVIAVNVAVERLKRLGFIVEDAEGKWMDGVGPTSIVSDRKSTKARRMLQSQVLELAQKSLDSVPLEEREQSAVIMAIDTKKIPEAKKIIDQFRRDMITLLAGSQAKKNRVAVLNISLFPVSDDQMVDHQLKVRSKHQQNERSTL